MHTLGLRGEPSAGSGHTLEIMLVALRATHEHLDLEVLDALTRGSESLSTAIDEVHAELIARRDEAAREDPLRAGGEAVLDGWVAVSTCNRLEVYLDTSRFHDGVDIVIDAVTRTSGLDRDVVALCFEAAMDTPVTQHLYEVTAGLRSLVLGEAEIAGQIRTAYEAARSEGRTTSMLHDLFQHAFRAQKRVTTQAPVGAAGRSSAAIALDRADIDLGGLAGRSVLVVGTGAYARLGVAELVRRGVTAVRVHSGSGRASGFAARHGVDVVPEGGLDDAIRAADLVLACSGRGTTLFPEQFLTAGRTVVLDLALHSDLHPLVRHLKGITVIGLADLQLDPGATDSSALTEAQRIIAETVETFRTQQEVRRVDPAMAALRREVADAADGEIDRLRREVSGETADQLERSVRRILAKVMHAPSARARQLAEDGQADAYVEAFHTIFGIDISGSGGGASPDRAGEDTQLEAVDWMRVDRTALPRDLAAQSVPEMARLARVALRQGHGPVAPSPPTEQTSP